MNRKTEIFEASSIKVAAIDLDGVVYQGANLIPGSLEAITRIGQRGIKVYFLTNNSSRSSLAIKEKLNKMGIEANTENIITSVTATRLLLERIDPTRQSRIFVLGSKDLSAEIREAGFTLTYTPDCDYLVVGFDPQFSYETVCSGLDAVMGGAKFIACNREANYVVEGDHLKPGCGAMVAALEVSSGIRPHYIAGKPECLMVEAVSGRENCQPSEIVIIGDTLDSDIRMANQFGSPSVWIQRDQALQKQKAVPSFIVKTLADLG